MDKRLILAATGVVFLAAAFAQPACAVLNPLGFYHLGESDAGVVVGGPVSTTVESLGLRTGVDMTTFSSSTDLKYSSDTPPSIASTRSIVFDAGAEMLTSPATKWYEGTGGFRWGAEMFIKPDASLAGKETVLYHNGAQFKWGITSAGRFYVNTTGPGTTDVKLGQWQHVAFITSGSFWQIYVDGVAQFATQPNFQYDAPNGVASLGGGVSDLETTYAGLIDEHRTFTWTGAFNPNELLWFQGRKAGDVNEDGLVNSADYNIWRANVGADITALTALQGRALGDVNGDRAINLIDFGLIKSNKSPGASFGIPEPSSAVLLIASLMIGLRRCRSRGTRAAAMLSAAVFASTLLPASTASAQAQAVWGGGNGNWNDANWTGGSGAGGRPGAGDNILLPPTTGTLTVSSNLGSTFGMVRQEGGILDITAPGVMAISGAFENGRGTAASGGEVRLAGSLNIGGELDVAYDVAGRVRVLGSGTLTTTGNMDTWWTGPAIVDLSAATNITIGATYYHGTAATINANINSASFSPIKVLTDLSIQGGTLNVNFTDGFVPTLANSWNLFDTPTRAGTIPTVNATGLAPGTRLALNYTAGGTLGQVVTIDIDSTLSLKVDQSSGMLTLENPAAGATPMNIDGYIIRSATTALNPAGFTGLGQAGWLPGTTPSQTNKVLSETNFNGSLSIAQGASYPLGAAFAVGGAQDLSIEFKLVTGEVLVGSVQYLAPSLAADFDGNGVVNGLDLAKWKTNYGKATGAVKADGDFNLDGRVDGADLLGWQTQSGLGSGGAAAVPEPASWALAALTLLFGATRRRIWL